MCHTLHKQLQQAGRAHPRQEAAALGPCGHVEVHLCIVRQGVHLQLHAQLVVLKLIPVVKEFTLHDLQWAQTMQTTQLMAFKADRAQADPRPDQPQGLLGPPGCQAQAKLAC